MSEPHWDLEAAIPLLPKQYGSTSASEATPKLPSDIEKPTEIDESIPWYARPGVRVLFAAWSLFLLIMLGVLKQFLEGHDPNGYSREVLVHNIPFTTLQQRPWS